MTDPATQSWLDAALEGPDVPGREAARANFAETGLPHRRMEDWKYTDLRARLAEALPAAEPLPTRSDTIGPFAKPPEDVAADELVAPGQATAPVSALAVTEICFGNGFLAHAEETPDGVDPLALSDALLMKAPWVLNYLGSVDAPEGHPMLALNRALMRDGLCLKVAAGLKAGNILLSHEGRSGRQIVRNLIVLKEGAELTLIEAHQGSEEPQQFQQVTEVIVGKGAKLTHIRLQDAGAKTAHLCTDLVDVAAEANYRGFVLTTGSELSRQESFIEFSGEHAEAHISGAYLLSGKQHADMTTRVNHAVPHCVSREVFKGVIADDARGVFQGRINVAEDAQKTDGHMLNKTLLLSDKAEMDAKPELEIYADDVKCSHGATTGQLDKDQLFYLRARGIDEGSARGLLMQSFLAEALMEVEDEQIREVLQARVNAWLDTHAEAWRAAE